MLKHQRHETKIDRFTPPEVLDWVLCLQLKTYLALIASGTELLATILRNITHIVKSMKISKL